MKFASPLVHVLLPLSFFVQARCIAAEDTSNHMLVPGDVQLLKRGDGNVSTDPNLTSQRILVTALGQVVHPGVYSAPNQNQLFTLSTLLEMAGGMTPSANVRKVQITRLHPKVGIEVDLWKLLFDGDINEDLVLHLDDVVYIPTAETTAGKTHARQMRVAGKVRVSGAVKLPGLIRVPSKGKDLLELIALAGGLTGDAGETVVLSRLNEHGAVVSERIPVLELSKHRGLAGDLLVAKFKRTVRKTSPTVRVEEAPVCDFMPPNFRRNAIVPDE